MCSPKPPRSSTCACTGRCCAGPLRQHAAAEALGQAWRIAGALLKTWLWVPVGNTGGAGVSGLEPMPVPANLQRLIDFARL